MNELALSVFVSTGVGVATSIPIQIYARKHRETHDLLFAMLYFFFAIIVEMQNISCVVSVTSGEERVGIISCGTIAFVFAFLLTSLIAGVIAESRHRGRASDD